MGVIFGRVGSSVRDSRGGKEHCAEAADVGSSNLPQPIESLITDQRE